MSDALSAISQNMALYQQQVAMLSLRQEAQAQRAVVDLLAQAAAPTPASNPPGLGGVVDTYA
jgi:aspartate/tyrosine/aromatic aminotransferase